MELCRQAIDLIVAEANARTYTPAYLLEFGSGKSTAAFVERTKAIIDSFDHNPNYACNVRNDRLTVRIRGLVQWSDDQYEGMFTLGIPLRDGESAINETGHTRAHNCFYDIANCDLKDYYDICVLDGPFGNGRSVAFLHLRGRMHAGGLILIDDYDHYPFLDDLRRVARCELDISTHGDYAVARLLGTF